MDDEVKEFVDDGIEDILPLLRKINIDSVRDYCQRRISSLYSYKDITFRALHYSLLDEYSDYRCASIKQTINSAKKSHDPKYDQLLEFIIDCIISVLNINKNLYNCVSKAINGDSEEFLHITNKLYKEIIEYICNKYESAISIDEYDEIYSIVDKYDSEHENRYPVQ